SSIRCLLSFHHLYLSTFFYNHTSPTVIYTLSLHDALPISIRKEERHVRPAQPQAGALVPVPVQRRRRHRRRRRRQPPPPPRPHQDRKSTRLNSSHGSISYAVFCLKKKKKIISRKSINNHNI